MHYTLNKLLLLSLKLGSHRQKCSGAELLGMCFACLVTSILPPVFFSAQVPPAWMHNCAQERDFIKENTCQKKVKTLGLFETNGEAELKLMR